MIFLPETVDSFELGGKFSLDAWRGLLDVSLFHEEFQGYQLTAFTGLAFEALNVPEVTSRGVEIEARGAVSESLEIFGGLTYADVRFGDGPEHGFRAGRQLTHAPKVTTVGGVTTRFPLGPLAAAFNIDARYTSEHNTGANLDPLKHQDAYTVVNARLIFRSSRRHQPVDGGFLGAEPDRRTICRYHFRRSVADRHLQCLHRRPAAVRREHPLRLLVGGTSTLGTAPLHGAVADSADGRGREFGLHIAAVFATHGVECVGDLAQGTGLDCLHEFLEDVASPPRNSLKACQRLR